MGVGEVTFGGECRQSAPGAALSDRASSPGGLNGLNGLDGRDPASSNVVGLEALTTYPGGKNGAGIYQRLINLMPPHQVYIEAFLGSGAILRRKRPASTNIGIDVDAGVIARHPPSPERFGGTSFEFIAADAVTWLREYFETAQISPRTLVYCDPPYLGRTRGRPTRPLYDRELLTIREHAALLEVLTSIPGLKMISGYRCRLYDRVLADWTRVDYQAMTRGGLKPESVWFNYPPPTVLHDYRFLGVDYHDRCRIGRKIGRWVRRLGALPALERSAVIDALGVTAEARRQF